MQKIGRSLPRLLTEEEEEVEALLSAPVVTLLPSVAATAPCSRCCTPTGLRVSERVNLRHGGDQSQPGRDAHRRPG
jgi:hypothetical protein